MKFLIVSDSHGDYNYLQQIIYSNQDVDVFIHLGDYEIPEYLLNRFIFVRGNCDFLSDAPKFRDIDYGEFNIHFEHGNNIDFYNFEKYIESKECDIFLFGHTHKKFAKEIGNTYVFNPGSLTRPRDSSLGSYLILEIKDKNNITYKFKTVEL